MKLFVLCSQFVGWFYSTEPLTQSWFQRIFSNILTLWVTDYSFFNLFFFNISTYQDYAESQTCLSQLLFRSSWFLPVLLAFSGSLMLWWIMTCMVDGVCVVDCYFSYSCFDKVWSSFHILQHSLYMFIICLCIFVCVQHVCCHHTNVNRLLNVCADRGAVHFS